MQRRFTRLTRHRDGARSLSHSLPLRQQLPLERLMRPTAAAIWAVEAPHGNRWWRDEAGSPGGSRAGRSSGRGAETGSPAAALTEICSGAHGGTSPPGLRGWARDGPNRFKEYCCGFPYLFLPLALKHDYLGPSRTIEPLP